MDALVAIDALDDLIHNSPAVFLSDDVRVDPDEMDELLGHVRDGLSAEIRDAGRSASWPLLEELERYVREARPARMGRGVRIDKDVIYDILDRLRATAPEDIRRSRGT